MDKRDIESPNVYKYKVEPVIDSATGEIIEEGGYIDDPDFYAARLERTLSRMTLEQKGQVLQSVLEGIEGDNPDFSSISGNGIYNQVSQMSYEQKQLFFEKAAEFEKKNIETDISTAKHI